MGLSTLKRKSKKKVSGAQSNGREFTLTSKIPSSALITTEKDFISPSIIKEVSPKELSEESGVKFNDYMVEIGTTAETKRYYRTLFAELTGGNTVAGILDKLYTGEFGQGNLEADMDVALHIIPVETSTELDKVNSRIRAIKSDLYREMPDEKRVKLQDELRDKEEQSNRLRLNVEKAFRASIQIVLSSNDPVALKKFTNLITRRLMSSQIVLRAADGKQLDAFLNVLPLKDDPTYAEHTHSFETSNLADMFMFGNGTVSHHSGIVWGLDHNNRPIMYDGWDKSLMNRNIIITGVSGGGKTFAALKLIHHDVLRGIRHAIICPKGDYRRYLDSMGCPYYDFGSSNDLNINFFEVDVEEIFVNGKMKKIVNLERTITAASAIVFKMIRVYDSELLRGVVKRRIEDAIRKLFKKCEITKEPESIYEEHVNTQAGIFNTARQKKRMPQLSDLQKLLKEDSRMAQVAEILEGFTKEHGMSDRSIFDCQSNINIKDAPLFAFGLSELDEEIMRPIGLFIATKWLASKFSHKDRHIPKRLVVDEAQVIMNDEETAKWLENEFRIVRFFNTSMCAITQGYEVFERSVYGPAIMKNAPTKVFMKQDNSDKEKLQKVFNLTAKEVTFLTSQAKQGLGILRLDEERTTIQVTGTPYEEYMFETEASKLEQKRAAYEAFKAQKNKKYKYS